MTSDAAIELAGVKRRLGDFTLGPLNWIVPRGVTMGLIGLNGAGKTTTIDLIMGLVRPDEGSIKVFGLNQPHDAVAIKYKTAYVNPDLDFTAWENVGRAMNFVRGFYPDWDQARCERLMTEFGLKRNDRITKKSLGARIKLALTAALSRDADLLLLDEPTVGLDPSAHDFLFSELQALMTRETRSIVISSHDVETLERRADYITFLDHGVILATGRVDDLLGRYIQADLRILEERPIWTPLRNSETKSHGIKLMTREGDRVRALVDTQICPLESLPHSGAEVITTVGLSLRDLFLSLTRE